MLQAPVSCGPRRPVIAWHSQRQPCSDNGRRDLPSADEVAVVSREARIRTTTFELRLYVRTAARAVRCPTYPSSRWAARSVSRTPSDEGLGVMVRHLLPVPERPRRQRWHATGMAPGPVQGVLASAAVTYHQGRKGCAGAYTTAGKGTCLPSSGPSTSSRRRACWSSCGPPARSVRPRRRLSDSTTRRPEHGRSASV